ncbi:MAG: hypothetical protein J3K34DRAFT_147108 [Monoraphidium minutum]|nr:MAG: hypothetical protein J3K34DRAFT_147108 [Monoraphidium minutum]
MPGITLLNVTGDARETLQAALEALGQPDVASQAREAPSKREVVQLAERVKNDAAKVGVMLGQADGGAAALPPDVAASLVGALQQSALALCAACYALSGAAAGPTLRKDVRKLAAGVVEPCIALTRAVEAGGDLKRAVGRVWAGCDAAAKAGLDNRGALFKGLAGVMAVLKDTLREMDELDEEGPASGSGYESDDDTSSGGAAAGGSGGGAGAGAAAEPQGTGSDGGGEAAAASSGSDGDGGGGGGGGGGSPRNLRELADLDFEPGALSAPERAVLGGCRALMAAAADVLKALGRALLQGPALAAGGGGPGGGEALDGWESALFHARNLQRCVEDLGAAMYPPQDLPEVTSAADGVTTTAELMLDECPAPDALGGALPGLAGALAAAAARVEAAVAAAEGAEAAEAAAGGS